jgi:15-cis-phytoene synthase
LFGIDDAMADVALRAREPQLAVIKLAWWREQLQAIDVSPPPAEPRLRDAARELLPKGVTGEMLATLEDGWLGVLDGDADSVASRGATLFALFERLLGGKGQVEEAGRPWALADLSRRTGDPRWLQQASVPQLRTERADRPLTALAALAARDARRGFPLEPEGTPGRAWALIRHRITGQL